MITEVNEKDCHALLSSTTVGRLGFVQDGRVLVIPVNYVLDGSDVVIRTAPDGLLSGLSSSREVVAFEVDHHDDLGGSGWSVLLNGPVTEMPAAEVDAVPGTRRARPWAGGDRSLALRLHPESITGRRVHRQRG